MKNPAYKSDCTDAVADYDYELGILEHDGQPVTVQEAAPLDTQPDKTPTKRRLVAIVGFVLTVIVGCAYFAGTHTSDSQQAPESTSVSDDRSVWLDSITLPPPTPIPTPSISPIPAPEPAPETKPGDFCDSIDDPDLSYPATALPEPWPFVPVSGWTWAIGPAGLPPQIIPDEKIGWQWVWYFDYRRGGENYRLCP